MVHTGAGHCSQQPARTQTAERAVILSVAGRYLLILHMPVVACFNLQHESQNDGLHL